MSYTSYKSNSLVFPHGGYKQLEVYKTAVIISDGTEFFCKKWIKDFKLSSQTCQPVAYATGVCRRVNGAVRSGKQCIAEGSINSGTSKKLELKLIGNARGSYGELLEDYEDFLRQRKLKLWEKESKASLAIRRLAYRKDRSYKTYKSYIESSNPEITANTLICLVNQENFLLDRLLRKLEKDFLEKGGFTENLFKKRREYLRK